MQKLWARLALLAGILLCLAGAGLIAVYIADAVLARFGEADQSLLYWYLPFLLFGVIGLAAGFGLVVSGARSVKKDRQS